MHDLDALFFPRSIAVIGASDRPLTIGHRIVSNLLDNGFTGPVYPINPRAAPILGLTSYPSITEVPETVDLAHVIVRNTLVAGVLEDCAARGVKVAIVNTSGFAETGEHGAALERELVAIGRRTGLRLFGPNCQGVMNTDPAVSLYSNFTFARMTPGRISMVCQGGGVAEVINNSFGMAGAGQRMYASNGNACDISIPEIIAYYGADQGTGVVVVHLESIADPAEFLERVRPVAATTPVLALKSGTTPEGARAVSSHTGGLMAGDTVTDVLFDSCGVLRFATIGELCEAAQAFAAQPVPRGPAVGMVTNAGSPAIIVTDEAVTAGLEVPDLGPEARAFLAERLQAIASVNNPIDMMATASGEEFSVSLQALVDEPSVDAVVVCFMTPFFVDTAGIARAIEHHAARTDKTLLAVAMTDPDGKPEWRDTVDRVRAAGVPVYYLPEAAARVLHHMDRFRRLRDREEDTPPELDVDRAAAETVIRSAGDGFLALHEVGAVLDAYGIPLVPEARGADHQALIAAAGELGYPVTLKAEAPTLVHKTEAGAVVCDLRDEQDLRHALHDLGERLGGHDGLGFVVQPHLAGGVEVIIGGARAPGLGSTVMFGLGGIHVELHRDVVFKLAPIGRSAAGQMLGSIAAAPLLDACRGREAIDRAALADVLVRVSLLLADLPQIAELDLNPVIAFPDGRRTAAVDARIRIERS
jgi:acetyltransferase